MNKLNIVLTHFTRKYFDVKARTNFYEFWIVMPIYAACALIILWLSYSGFSRAAIWILSAIIFIPSQTLAIRRFNDAGLTKKDYLIFAFAISILAIIAYLFHIFGNIFFMAVTLWFLLATVIAFLFQFLRPSI